MSRLEAGFEGMMALLFLIAAALAVTMVGRGLVNSEASRVEQMDRLEQLRDLRAHLEPGVRVTEQVRTRLRRTPFLDDYLVDVVDGPYGSHLSVRLEGDS